MRILSMKIKYICNCKKFDFSKKNYVYWENRKTTSDEADIIDFIKKKIDLNNKILLHLGIGNSEIASIYKGAKKIIGITISNSEIQKAKDLKLKNYNVFLFDKYSINFCEFIRKFKFDYIVDTNLKSYACCQESFDYMLLTLKEILLDDGKLITSRKGMNWYKKLKPKLSFNFKDFFYFKLKEIDGDKLNILSINELEKFSNYYKLKLTYDERVLYLSK